MRVLHRRGALAGAVTLGTATALGSSPAAAQPAEEQAVARAVEALRQAMLEPNRQALEALCADQLSYGHSAGRIETKAQFIDALVNRTSVLRSINLSDQTIAVVGEDAIVRHLFTGESMSGGTASPVRVGVLQMWKKQGGNWRLLARQAFRI